MRTTNLPAQALLHAGALVLFVAAAILYLSSRVWVLLGVLGALCEIAAWIALFCARKKPG